jgi:peptide/nickel transport system permease protein
MAMETQKENRPEVKAPRQARRIPFIDTEELRISWRIFRSSYITLIGAFISITFIIVALVVWISNNAILPFNPYAISPSTILQAPSMHHLLGTDDLGRDILTRILAAAPIDAEVAFSVVGSAVILGLLIGGLAGFVGGLVEEVIMRITDIFLAFPGLVLALAIVASLGPSITNTILALAPVWWPSYTRLARGETLTLKSQQFVEASTAAGQKTRYTILKHIIPNILPVLLVYATLDIGNVILVFSVLSFIGLGAQPPTPEWGLLSAQGEQYLRSAPWYPIAPALTILIVAIGFSLFGDGLRDALDPKVRGLFS